MRFRGKRVLVTGRLGFIGSNLVIQLVKEGAAVTVADNLLPGVEATFTRSGQYMMIC